MCNGTSSLLLRHPPQNWFGGLGDSQNRFRGHTEILTSVQPEALTLPCLCTTALLSISCSLRFSQPCSCSLFPVSLLPLPAVPLTPASFSHPANQACCALPVGRPSREERELGCVIIKCSSFLTSSQLHFQNGSRLPRQRLPRSQQKLCLEILEWILNCNLFLLH